MSRRWFAQGSAGAGYLFYNRSVYAVPHGIQYSASGGIGFKTGSQTFVGSVGRTFGDAYAVGGASTLSATGSWNWRPFRTLWSVFAGAGYQRLKSYAYATSEGLSASAGAARPLGHHFSLAAQYGYYWIPSDLLLGQGDVSQKGVSVSLSWSPAARR